MPTLLLTRTRSFFFIVAALFALNACTLDESSFSNASTSNAAAPAYWPTTAWQTSPPESHGFSSGAFTTLASDAAAALPYYTSLLVIKDGYLVHESYHDSGSETGTTADTRHHVWSISKSVTSMTIGRAWTRGDLNNLDVRAGDIFPSEAFGTLPTNDTRRDITLRHALQMRSGLGWNEPAWLLTAKDPLIKVFTTPYDDCASVSAGNAILCSIVHQTSAYAPGTVWNYNTYDTYLASAFFTQITGSTLNAYANQYLFAPLGITFDPAEDWPDLGLNYTYGGGLLRIRSRDLAKLGLLMLYDGRWENQQLLSPEWLSMALTEQGAGLAARFDSSGDPTTAAAQDLHYGLQWWRRTGPGMSGPASISARGLGGQMMHIFKEHGLIIVITCDSDSIATDRSPAIMSFLQTQIVSKLTP